jgi:hypothetical protein
MLPNLETCCIRQSGTVDASCKPFKSVNVPNLRRVMVQDSLAGGAESFGHLYDSIVPQLDHIELKGLVSADVSHILGLATSLHSLRVQCDSINGPIPSIRDELIKLDVKELHYVEYKRCEGEDWETAFRSIRDFKEVMEKNDNLKSVKLAFRYHYNNTLSQDAGDQSLAWWKEMKEETKLICVKKGIDVLKLVAVVNSGRQYIFTWEC